MKASLVGRQKGAVALAFIAVFVIFFTLFPAALSDKAQASRQR
ncbi:hypothetical protein [Pseudomonas putida]|nr:hypothetical protein [Pseudomonas putida]MDD2050463.1 hypothetical protein [Pseudomonas putida]